MKIHRTFLILAFLVVALSVPLAGMATEISGSSVTIPYLYQEYLQGEESDYLALYEFADFEARDVLTPGLDVYFSGWGRWDSMDSQDPEDENAVGDAELLTAYVKWQHEEGILDVSLGRRFVRLGSSGERIDGLDFRLEPLPGFGIQGFGGIPVISEIGERDGDYAYGGRLYGGWKQYFEIGVSSFAFTEEEEPDRMSLGGDLAILPAAWLDFFGHAYYEYLYSSIYDASAMAIVRPYKDLKVIAEYEQQMPSAFLGMQSFFSVFTFETIKKVNSEVKYLLMRRIALAAAYNHYMYDEDDPADRYGGSAGVLWGKDRSNTLNLGAYRLDRDENGYLELRAYLYQGVAKKLFGTIDAIHYTLDEEIYGEDQGFNGSMSLGWHINEDLDISAAGFYMTSPAYDEDVRGLLKVAYNFNKIF